MRRRYSVAAAMTLVEEGLAVGTVAEANTKRKKYIYYFENGRYETIFVRFPFQYLFVETTEIELDGITPIKSIVET